MSASSLSQVTFFSWNLIMISPSFFLWENSFQTQSSSASNFLDLTSGTMVSATARSKWPFSPPVWSHTVLCELLKQALVLAWNTISLSNTTSACIILKSSLLWLIEPVSPKNRRQIPCIFQVLSISSFPLHLPSPHLHYLAFSQNTKSPCIFTCRRRYLRESLAHMFCRGLDFEFQFGSTQSDEEIL